MAGSSWTVQGLVAGILGALQSLAFIAMNIIPCLYYFQANNKEDSLGKIFYVNFIEDFKDGLKAMLASQTAINIIWLLSSVTLIISNYSHVACAVRQWVVVTTLVIITSFICCSYFLAQAIPAIHNDSNASLNRTNVSFHASLTSTETSWKKEFSYLLVALSNGTIVLWILNIILAVLVHNRARELTLRAKVKPGFGNTAFGNNQTYPKVTMDERPTRNDENTRETSFHLQRPHKDPIPPPMQERRGFNQFHHDDEDERPVPLPHLGLNPYNERRDSPSGYAQDAQYHDSFGSPPNLDDSGASDSNFAFKRKSLYTYENNSTEIAKRMAKFDSDNALRRQDQPRPMTNVERIESLRRQEQPGLEPREPIRRPNELSPASSRVERNESMNRLSKLNPRIYQPTAFEPFGRHSISYPAHPPLVRSGGGRGNTGYLSSEDQNRDPQRQLKPTPDRRVYNSDRESDSRPSTPRNGPIGHGDRMPRYDNPTFNPIQKTSPRHQDYQDNTRGYGHQESFPNRRPEYDDRSYDNFREEGYDNFREGGYDNQGYNRGPRRH